MQNPVLFICYARTSMFARAGAISMLMLFIPL
jgi:hypothetical protein